MTNTLEHKQNRTEDACPCNCHESSQICSMCASMEGYKGSTTNTIEMAISVGRQAFFKAHVEFMAEKLKKRMDKEWGPTAEKAADAVFEAMGKQWMYMMMQEGTEVELRENLSKIFTEMKTTTK
jgi:hypothetical protein